MLLPLSSLLTGPLLARSLGPDGRGVMAALLAPISLANLMFTFGFPESVNYHVARSSLGRRGAIRASLAGGLVSGIVAAGILIACTPLLFNRYERFSGEERLLALTLPITITFAVYRGAWQGRRRINRINGERALGVTARLFTLVLLVGLGKLTPTNAAWVTVLAGVVGSLVLLSGLRFPTPAPGTVDTTLRQVAVYAGAAALGTLGGFVIVRLDQTLLAPLAGARELGYYAVAASLAELPIAFVSGVQDTVATVAAGTGDALMAGNATRVTVALLLPFCGIGAVTAPWAIPLVFGRSFDSSVLMTQILLAGSVASGAAVVLGAGLMAAGRPILRSLSQGLGALVTVPLLLLLVPRLGGLGASLATTLTYILLAMTMCFLLSRQSGMHMRDCLLPRRSDYGAIWSLASTAVSSRRRPKPRHARRK